MKDTKITAVLFLCLYFLHGNIPSVLGITCPAVAQPNAEWEYVNSTMDNGNLVNIICHPGYFMAIGENNMTSQCNETAGSWVPPFLPCVEIDCGSPDPGTGAVLTYENSTLGLSEFGQNVTYTCKSGKFFAKDIRDDQAEIVQVTCNYLGVWEVITGYTQTTDKQFTCAGLISYQGCREITEVLTVTLTETKSEASGNRNDCFDYCRGLDKLFAARQGSTCACLDNQNYTDVTNDECDTKCYDGQSYCGNNETLYSVYSTVADCIDIDASALTTVEGTRTGLTCQQFCRGQDKRLSFWRGGVYKCACFDDIPNYTGLLMTTCNLQESIENDTTIGELYVTETLNPFSVENCGDIFDNGVYYHGDYYLNNGSKVFCQFLDNSNECDFNWIAYEGNCYMFDSEQHSMAVQFEACKARNSLLVSVGGSAEWQFINRAMDAIGHMSSGSAYIGLYDTQKTFSYMWTDETAVTYRKFANTYPDQIINRCVKWMNSYMQTLDCTVQTGAICERSQASIGCASVDLNTITPLLHSSKMSTPLCFETCRSAGHKYSITHNTSCYCDDDLINYSLTDWTECTMPCPGNMYQMCGGNGTNHVFITSDNGQPYRDGCRSMILGSLMTNVTIRLDNGSLDVVDCDKFAGVLCPESWIEINGRCYRFYPEAIADPAFTCATMGGYLAVYETLAEASDVINIIQTTPMLAAIDYWLFGLFQQRKDGSSNPRYINGAWVNDSMREMVEGMNSFCFAHPSSNVTDIIGVDCGSVPYICETGDDYLGCYNTPDLNLREITVYKNLDVLQCLETCKATGKPLAGLKGRGACHCLESSDLVGLKAESENLCVKSCCYMQNCGSPEQVTVYRVDYSRNASSCEDLYEQGVMLSGRYKMNDASNVWCGMKDSAYLVEQVVAYETSSNSDIDFSDLTWIRVGTGGVDFAIDVISSAQASTLVDICNDIYTPASIVAPVITPEQMKLVTDVLRWSLDYTYSTPAYIGMVDEFYMGAYTMSDGTLTRLTPTEIDRVVQNVFADPSLSTYTQVNYTGSYVFANDAELRHAVCQRDTSYQGCFEIIGDYWSLITFGGFSNYPSMSLTLCRQICQGHFMTELLLSTTDCICFNQTGESAVTITGFTETNTSYCQHQCPGNRLQLCGIDNYFRHHHIEEDIAGSCQELYDNFVVVQYTYLINGTQQQCGLDDRTQVCPAGFIAKGGKCYRIQSRRDQTIMAAASQCFNLNSYLASPMNQDDLDNIQDLIQSFTATRTVEMWALGYYSMFSQGKFVTAAGHMMPVDNPILANLSTAQQCVALNTTTGALVSVSCYTQLPFICEISDVLSGCGQVNKTMITTAPLTLTHGMTIQQCLAYCSGVYRQLSGHAAFLRGAECLCSDQLLSVLNMEQECTASCSGLFTQNCGSDSSNDVYSIYIADNYQTEYTCYGCDELLTYGVVQPATYHIDNDMLKTCFKYSPKSDLILSDMADLQVNTSASKPFFTSSNARMKLKQLTYNGWRGEVVDPIFVQFSLDGYYVIEGFVIQGGMTSASVTTSIDNIVFEEHPDKVITIPNTYQSTTWISLSVPVVAKYITITGESWDDPYNRKGSVEVVGYAYASHDFTDDYLGCHGNLNITNESYQILGEDYTSCRDICRESGFPYVVYFTGDICMCIAAAATSTRDFYDDTEGGCNASCFSGMARCPQAGSDNYPLYTTTDLTCPAVSVNNSDLSWVTVVNMTTNNSYPIVTSLFFNCTWGYEIGDGASTVASTKCYNFQKYSHNLTGVSCDRVNCGPFQSVANAEITFTYDNSTLYTDLVQYQCTDEVDKFGGREPVWNMTCMGDKQWQPPATDCELTRCLEVPTVLNAVSNSSATISLYHAVVKYTCDDGCRFPSDNETEKYIQCQLTGAWTEIEPSCERYRCSTEPPSIPHATQIPTNDILEVLYRCDGDKLFSDKLKEKTVRCNVTSFLWEGADDECQSRIAESHVCLAENNHRVNNTPAESLYTRSVFDCALHCLENSACTSYNFQDSMSTENINCQLFTQLYEELDSETTSGWDVFKMTQC